MFDYKDPGVDPVYCDNHSDPPPAECILCENIADDDTFFPYCSASCARQADGESDEDEQADEREEEERERHADDGLEYGHPDDYRNGRE